MDDRLAELRECERAATEAIGEANPIEGWAADEIARLRRYEAWIDSHPFIRDTFEEWNGGQEALSHDPTVEARVKEIIAGGVSSVTFARKLAKVEFARCPECGGDGKMWSHPSCGVKIDCSCGVRSDLDDWIHGRVTLRRNSKGTYDYVPRHPQPAP